MTRNRTAAIASIVFAIACAPSTPEEQFVNAAAAALGGRDRVLAVRTLVLEGEGRMFNLGQDMRPGASDQTFTISDWKRQIDLTSPRYRIEFTRTPTFAYFQGQVPQRQVQALDDSIAFNVSPTGTATRLGAQAAEDRRADRYHHPLAIVVAALAPNAAVTNVRTQGAERLADIRTADDVRLVLATDGAGLPMRVESRSYHPNLGDVTLATHFADYVDSTGIKVPSRLLTKVDDFTTAEIRLTSHGVNRDIDDLTAPAAVAAAPAPTPAQPAVVAEPVAAGVWLLAGQSHHSALIELSKELWLVDAPQSEARTVAVIAKAREVVPDKPLTKLVTTHHHFDHTAGFRAAIAEGLTIVTHEGNRAFFEEMARRPHTRVPDMLARNPKPVAVETVSDELVVKDAARTVAIYHVAGNPHSDTMVMVYLPAERVVIQVDAFSPGSQVSPYAANLLENITRRNLRVDRVVSLHGGVAPFSELLRFRAMEGKGAP